MTELSGIWARRKAAVKAEAEQDARVSEAAALAEQQQKFDEMSDADVLAALDLPDPDTLALGDDFKVFMAKAVPDRIRRRALRVLWRSNPALANLDQLVDYGEDFTDSATVVENLQTAYQVGKGMLKHVEAMAKPEAVEEIVEDDDDTPVVEEVIATPEEPEPMVSAVEPLQESDPPEVVTTAIRPRRMVFQTEDVT